MKSLTEILHVFTAVNMVVKPCENVRMKRKVTKCILGSLEEMHFTFYGKICFYISVNEPHKSPIIGLQFRKLYQTF
jgi:hypothetical protein